MNFMEKYGQRLFSIKLQHGDLFGHLYLLANLTFMIWFKCDFKCNLKYKNYVLIKYLSEIGHG